PNNFSTADLIIGANTLDAPFSVNVSDNVVRIGDGADDTNTPTLSFFASNGVDTGSLLYTDADVFQFSGGDVAIDQALTISGGELSLTPLSSPPSTTEGKLYYDSVDDNLYVYANGGW